MKYFLIILLFSFQALAREVSITIDDFNFENSEYLSSQKRDEKILEHLRDAKVKAIGFVTTKYINSEMAKNALVKWSENGHTLANHTESHFNYHSKSFKEFSEDILTAEEKLKPYKGFKKLFRFPYLKEGDTTEKRDQLRQFLKQRGYQNGSVSIDASDWYINMRLLKRLKENPNANIEGFRKYYLEHMMERSEYYSKLSKEVLGRDVKFTLLIHHNLTTALFLGDLIDMYKKRGWKVIDALEAFKDPIYKEEVLTLPAGESIVWSIAKLKGTSSLRYPAESDIYEKDRMDSRGL